MARLVPTDLSNAARSAGEAAEHTTLRTLATALSDAYTIFHGVRWADESDRATPVGELDFVVVNQGGEVLLVEQKAGELSETDEGLVKVYGENAKTVADQVHRGFDHIKRKWAQANPGAGPIDVGYLLYLPDHAVTDVNAAGLAADRIVHAGGKDDLAARIAQLLGEGVDRDPARRQRVLGFFRQEVQVVPSLEHALDTQQRVYERLSEGIVRLGERLEMDPWRLRVIGRAGSGKSQLAMRTAERAVARGRRTLFVCFNRPLAERIEPLLEGATVDTFHGFCRELLESRGGTFDTARAHEPAFWREVEQQASDLVLDGGPAFETLVVDEGQDFEPEWFEILRMCVADGAEILWVEDPLQNLGGKDSVDLPEFVTYRTDENHRSPPSGLRALDKWLGIQCSSGNDLSAPPIECHHYTDDADQRRLIDERVEALVEAGFAPEDIVLLSVHGFRNAALAEAGSAGGYPLRRFTEEYTVEGNQIYAPGRILFDSVYRFKGQQSAAVLLVDIDFAAWRERHARGVLYTGMTRATRHLEMFYKGKSNISSVGQRADGITR